MNNRFLIFIALTALLAASLACKMPTATGNNPTERMITIDSLAVNPRESDGKNDLAVSFNYTPGTIDTVIICSIITPSGTEEKVWSAPFGKSAEAIQYKADFTIRVDVPGNYTLHCWDRSGSASESTSFSITAPAQPTATVLGSNFSGAPEKFTTARLEIMPGSSPIHATVRVFWGCQPPSGGHLVVLPDGSLEGICHETETGEGYVWVKDGDLTGKYDPNATIPNINFSLLTNTKLDGKTSQGEPLQYVTDETFIGGGSLESIDPATGAALFTGTATFTFKCKILVGTPICPNVDGSGGMSTSFSGEVSFKMTFFP